MPSGRAKPGISQRSTRKSWCRPSFTSSLKMVFSGPGISETRGIRQERKDRRLGDECRESSDGVLTSLIAHQDKESEGPFEVAAEARAGSGAVSGVQSESGSGASAAG
jgi:hypothetical protein